MIVYVLFVHKKSVSKRKVCIVFIKNKKLKKPKKTFLVGFFRWVFLGGFFWVGFLLPTLQPRRRWASRCASRMFRPGCATPSPTTCIGMRRPCGAAASGARGFGSREGVPGCRPPPPRPSPTSSASSTAGKHVRRRLANRCFGDPVQIRYQNPRKNVANKQWPLYFFPMSNSEVKFLTLKRSI